MNYSVIREIHFSYGHRLLNHPGKCARLHGHNGRVQIEISSSELNEQKMVMDFYEIKKVIGNWIDETLDHKMILGKADPLVKILKQAGEPIVVSAENPTAEVLAKWIFEEARKKGLPITKVTLWETENSAATYSA
ncbi:MAG: 6-carboxytetrahydropterin synthase QueD [Candidatus Omnitrophica bacterium]|nr:6-carboxytetrahydropterin synthase QueD [Candidatus Omnitrophota bacterium]